MSFKNEMSPEQGERHLRNLDAGLRTMPADLELQVAALRRQMRPLPTLQLLANLAVGTVFAGPEKSPVGPIEVEYATWLALLEPGPTTGATFIEGPVVKDIEDRIRKIVHQVLFYFQARYLLALQTGQSQSAGVSVRTQGYELLVRNPSYETHLLPVLRALFASFGSELNNLIGFTLDDALAAIQEIERLITERWRGRFARAVNEEKTLMLQMDLVRKGGVVDDDLPRRILQATHPMEISDVQNLIRNLMIAWAWIGIEDALTIGPKDLRQLPEAGGRAFLERFSTPFGQKPVKDDCWPSRYEVLERAPLLRLGADKFYAHLVGKLAWAVKPSLEEALKGSAHWQKYDTHRSQYLEVETLRLLGECLPGATVHHNLFYDVTNASGVQAPCQLDGLIKYDTTLILVEAKAGSISWPARRGAPKSMKSEIDALLGAPHEQALRARRYIEQAGNARFTLEDGEQVWVRWGDYKHIILVTSTLEPLTAFTAGMVDLQKEGILGAGDVPWAVDLLDLVALTELIEFGAELVDYLERRRQLRGLPIYAEELEMFGCYLTNGLSLAAASQAKPDVVMLSGHTKVLDEYFQQRPGATDQKVRKPRLAIPDNVRQRLEELSVGRSNGFVDHSLQILEAWRRSK